MPACGIVAWRIHVGVGMIACLLFGATDSALSEPQTGQSNGTSPDIGGCEAVIEYSAVTGDPVKANKSAIFRGFIVISEGRSGRIVGVWGVENNLEHSSGDVNLQWTFSEGEAIRGGADVFRADVFRAPGPSQITQERGVEFSTTTSDNMQTVELQFYSDNTTNVEIGFNAYKGLSNSSAPSEPVYKVGLPSEFKFNGLTCNRAPDVRLPQDVGVEYKDVVKPRKKVLELEYLPIEFTNMRFYYNEFASKFAIFAFRLKNVGNKPINLTDVELEYWFDGGDFQDKPPHLLYKSMCMTSTVTGCENFRIDILPGHRYIQGAHYKVKIGFSEEAGELSPELFLNFGHLGLGDEEEEEERPPFMLEAIVNVTSLQFFSQIDVTKDYSFLNTTVIEEESKLPPQVVSRKYEPNKKFPVYYKGEIVYGAPPKSGDNQQVKPVSDPNRNQCWFKKPGIQQCGLRVKYCCVKSRFD
ncbi:hypothetical protein BSKO_02619 [Bryopsis sp. KO-2023]|nr:hypothetical protein BSKO_02619 [Bryopsis sp. KO-2023]